MPIKKESLFTILRPFSPIYGSIMKTREKLYRNESISSIGFDVPVISVGNLTMGGTGKTPLVIYLAKYFSKKQFRPAIISRGYRGSAKKPVNIVSDFHNIFLTDAQAGDEPRLMAEKLPGIPVLTGKKRRLPCTHAIQQLGCDLLILDDGFQHLDVRRTLDLVLFNSDNINQEKHVFPGGELREPLSALNRCDCIIYTGATQSTESDIQAFSSLLESKGISKPFFKTSLEAPLLKDANNQQVNEHLLKEKGSLAFCGIGNPARFKDYLLASDMNLLMFRSFDDHHAYNQEDVADLEYHARQNGASYLLTTEKDFVKLRDLNFSMSVYTVTPKTKVQDDFDIFITDKINHFFIEE